MMRVIENANYSKVSFIRWRARRLADAFKRVWFMAFPVDLPDDPDSPPGIAKAAALREGAALSESVDVVAKRRAR